ncbi:SGNH hydrolase-type esterase domain-containing protein [Artemisia annua]|uniref:SGNH hydrolase-type esterase domain-containing protein n=1 Tax=Artemisia annua TaxID=35608 RepID=A0A2U1NT56_ARTAN|nr:SGNH hydrolase-type esterase domain-containing protein [Artemisia annua]
MVGFLPSIFGEQENDGIKVFGGDGWRVWWLPVTRESRGRETDGTTILPKDSNVSAFLVFGDSFVDQGNNNYVITLAKANVPPYGKDFVGGKPTGRFSNGKTIADFLASALGVKEYLPAYLDPSLQEKDLLTGVSFASGGAGYDHQTITITSALSLSVQLDMFKQYIEKLKRNIGDEAAKDIITNSVSLVVISGNDLWLSYYDIPVRRIQYDLPTYDNMLVKLALNFVQELYKLGARRIAVSSASPIGCYPAQRTIAGGPLRECPEERNQAAHLFNEMLKPQLQHFESSFPESRVAYIDFYNPVLNMIDNPHQYGFEVTDRGCCGTGVIEAGVALCNNLSLCHNSSKFMYWDSFHLSETGCNIFVNLIKSDLLNDLF